MTPSSVREEGAEPGTYKEIAIIPPRTPGGKQSYTAITNRASMQENPPDILLTNYFRIEWRLVKL